MGNRQWAVGGGEEKRREERPPPSAAQAPPPEARGRRKKEKDDGKKEMEVSIGLAASSMVESKVGWWGRMGNVPFLLVIRVYRVVLSPVVGGQCRFEPTCSRYAAEAYRLYGPISGTKMTAGRICRCHPWNVGGFDPVAIPGDDGQYDNGQCPDKGVQEGDEHGSNASGTKA